MPQTMAMAVDPAAMTMELSMYLAIGAFCQMSIKFDHMTLIGKIVPLMAKISDRLLRAVQAMTK